MLASEDQVVEEAVVSDDEEVGAMYLYLTHQLVWFDNINNPSFPLIFTTVSISLYLSSMSKKYDYTGILFDPGVGDLTLEIYKWVQVDAQSFKWSVKVYSNDEYFS